MVRIEIKRIETVERVETQQILIEETPTDKVKRGSYGDEYMTAKKYAPVEVKKTEVRELVILLQQMQDSEFDLNRVVRALNNID